MSARWTSRYAWTDVRDQVDLWPALVALVVARGVLWLAWRTVALAHRVCLALADRVGDAAAGDSPGSAHNPYVLRPRTAPDSQPTADPGYAPDDAPPADVISIRRAQR